MTDPTKAAEYFLRDLYECPGPGCCRDMAEEWPIEYPKAVAFAKAQRRQGAVDALRAMVERWEDCRAYATPNPGVVAALRAEADRIEGEDGE